MKNFIKKYNYQIVAITTMVCLVIASITMALIIFRPTDTVLGTLQKYWVLESLIVLCILVINIEHLLKIKFEYIGIWFVTIFVIFVGTIIYPIIWINTRIKYKDFINQLFF